MGSCYGQGEGHRRPSEGQCGRHKTIGVAGITAGQGECKIMHTGKVFSKCSYEIDGQILQQTEMEKDLGVIIKDS